MFTHIQLLAEADKLNKFALRLTKNKTDADDLFQSTCLRAFEKSDTFEDGTNLFGWTSKIMFNLFATDYRRRLKFDLSDSLDIRAVPPMQEIHTEIMNVKRAMLKVSSNHQEIITMICMHGLHYQEVAKKLDIPLGTVRSRLARARKELQNAMTTSTIPTFKSVKIFGDTKLPIIPAFIAAQAIKKSLSA